MKKILISMVLITTGLILYAQTVNVTFRVDMQDQVVSPNGVHIAGNFQGWDPAATLMTNTVDDIYEYVYTTTPGLNIRYQFINGNTWDDAEDVPPCCDLNGNRVFTVPANNIVLPDVCFGHCYPCDGFSNPVNVTFRVDLSAENYSTGAYIAGNSPSNPWVPVAMTDMGDDIFAITVTVQEGDCYSYLYLIDGTSWESVPPECGTDNGQGGFNRFIEVPGSNQILDAVCYGSCDTCDLTEITFQVDMSNETVSPFGVHVAGNFQGWNPSDTPMTDIGGGIYTVTVSIQRGLEMEYIFINGDNWAGQEIVPGACSNSATNRYYTVPDTPATLDLVCFESCNPCLTGAAIDVTFQVDMTLQIVSGLGVFLAGDFNNWSISANPMTNIGNNVYEVTVSLFENFDYAYKFVNGTSWETVPGACSLINGNRVVTVPTINTTLPLICYGECDTCVLPVHTFDLKVNLEGPFNGTDMNTDLYDMGVLPIAQPYHNSPWNYDGMETLTAPPEADIVDWIMVEFRETDGDAPSATPDKYLHRQAALLLSDGSIVQPDGSTLLEYTGPFLYNIYVVIQHRNHLAVMSANSLVATKGSYAYDFTDALSKAWQNGQIALGGGMYGMVGGDSDGSGTIDDYDKDLHWSEFAGMSGYFGSDLNLDSQVNNLDKTELWEINYEMVPQVPGGYYFECGATLVDFRDEQSYTTVQIGSQCWMAENLNIGTRIDGINDQTDNAEIEKYCYNDLESYCDTYGGLYQWDEMMEYETIEGIQGICPMGWHIPSDDEWCTLENYVDAGTISCSETEWRGIDAGYHLKSISGWNSKSNGDDLFGYNGLPSGARLGSGNFHFMGDMTYFWTSNESSFTHSWFRLLRFDYDQIFRNSTNEKLNGFVVRCIEGPQNLPPTLPYNPNPEDGSINISIDTTLSWSCSDPEWYPLTYNIYFGLESNPPLIQTNFADTFYIPGELLTDTIYYWKIVAYDIHGDSTVGVIWNFRTRLFECEDLLLDERNSQFYSTIQIGSQCWMAENLNIGTRINGINDQENNGVLEKYCYDDSEDSCNYYGALYQWNEMMLYTTKPGVQGICPPAWHIPSDEEWKQLEGEVDSQYGYPDPEWDDIGWRGSDAGLKLKSSSGWESGGDGDDYYNFTALPSGHRFAMEFFNLGSTCRFWSSTEENISSAWGCGLAHSHQTAARYNYQKSYGISVRCLQGYSNQPPSQAINPNPENGSINISLDTTLYWSASTDLNGDAITYNIYFGTESNPTLVQTNYPDTFYLPGTLYPGTIYYWKIVAFDIHGDSTDGVVWNFNTRLVECGEQLFDYRSKRLYNTIEIGTQCWMAENLNVGTRVDGGIYQSNNDTIEKYCYNDTDTYCDLFGGLYQWSEMMQFNYTPGKQGICPSGWHLPTDEEWKQLEGEVDNLYDYPDDEWDKINQRGSDAGFNLKSSSGWYLGGNGSDLYSFSVLPGGFRNNSNFEGLDSIGYFWTSTELYDYWSRELHYNSEGVLRDDDLSSNRGLSVRCLQDYQNQSPSQPFNPLPGDGSILISIDTTLSWTCTDPEGDDLTYFIYFGTETDPPLVQVNYPDTFYSPGTLQYNTIYYWKIVAYDGINYSFSPVWEFTTTLDPFWTCGDTMVDARDGQKYPTVVIGSQCWMAKNLNYGGTQTMENICYETYSSNCDTYGRLYTVSEAIASSPQGWHLPSDEEWTQLTTYLGGYLVAGGKMKETGTIHWNSPNPATNESGFTALPGGQMDPYFEFSNLEESGYFWTSTVNVDHYVWRRHLHHSSTSVGRISHNRYWTHSARYILDEFPPMQPYNPVPVIGSNTVDLNTNISWSCNDPTGTELTYNIYFGTATNPPLVQTNHPDTFYSPGILEYNTDYYWRVVAYDIHGDSAVSEVWNFETRPGFKCGGILIDDNDDQIYKTVEIDEQCWMAENLNIGGMINGGSNQTDNSTIEKYCYNNEPDSCTTYGGLYQWHEMMQYSTIPGAKGICPSLWHIPTNDEWTILFDKLGGDAVAGGKLKETGLLHWSSPNFGATDLVGFTALPGGNRNYPSGFFGTLGNKGHFWSSTGFLVNSARRQSLSYDNAEVNRGTTDRNYGFSVRCLLD